jgi:Fungal Zn(2)-Cys(6) binuclear cluster domain
MMTSLEPVLGIELLSGGLFLDPSHAALKVTGPLQQAASIVLGSTIGAPLDGSLLTAAMASKSSMAEADGRGAMDAAKKEDKDERKPAWSELKTKAGKERKRLPLACIACRRKKIRCSGEKPACKHCLRSRTPCVYKVTTRKAAPRTDYMTMLDKRLKRMEERVIKIIPDPEPTKMASIGRASVKPPAVPAPKTVGGKKRIAEEAFGAEVEQWAQSDAKVDNLRQPNLAEQADNRLLTDGVENLPSKEIQEHLAETFFDNCYGQAYYLLHKPSFMRRLK